MPKKRYIVDLTPDERDELLALTSKGEIRARKMKRAQILLKADQGATDAEIVAALGVSRPCVERTGEAASDQAAFRLCAELRLDVVLMDLVMPEMDGATTIRAMREQFAHVQVLALTGFTENGLVQDALHAGAIGCLLKDVPAEELAHAIRGTYVGRGTPSPVAAQALIHASTQRPTPSLELTERERAVLARLVEGLSNTEIAATLNVSPSTIKSHVSNILAKLGAASRTEAVALALRHRLIP